ncbi:hypothetical protein IFM89_016761 [Coptis chinensis]|uniref:Lipoxygenase domain-containing protein n=1 Tax=Coptis chinensis TaxID=261450 RepID=A0A835H5W7_9MAGN|nr:hypothetical protein IFM89_016761 [Coptis chinensis]
MKKPSSVFLFSILTLPTDLIKRGIAVKDPSHPHGLCLLIEDYPYDVDGLEIWSAIETWVQEYCSFYYPSDVFIQGDSELQSWWAEIHDVGHGDKKNEPWWPKMQTITKLTESCIMISGIPRICETNQNIERRIPSNLQPSVTNIADSSSYTLKSGLARSRVTSVFVSPLATSSSTSFEFSVIITTPFPDDSEHVDDLASERRG